MLVLPGCLRCFQGSAWLDSMTTARLAEAISGWQPTSLGGVLARAVADGLVGLVGIVVPYMIPLVLLLVALEQCGILPRIARVIDRAFHRIGAHGGVAPFSPASFATCRDLERGGDDEWPRAPVATVLTTFVPCSRARRSSSRSPAVPRCLGVAHLATAVLSSRCLGASLAPGPHHRHRRIASDCAIRSTPPKRCSPRRAASRASAHHRIAAAVAGSVVAGPPLALRADRAMNHLHRRSSPPGWACRSCRLPLLFCVLRQERRCS